LPLSDEIEFILEEKSVGGLDEEFREEAVRVAPDGFLAACKLAEPMIPSTA